MTPARLVSAVPVLLSLDIPATIAFYPTKIGFTCPSQDAGFAILQRDEVTLHFNECGEQHLVDWSSCRVAVANEDELYADCVRESVVHPNAPLEDTEYGTREFGLIDNHGVLITFFERTTRSS